MTDIPIIFSAPMVRALLDGRKTMTRRLAWAYGVTPPVKVAPPEWPTSLWQRVKCGDRLWVRENLAVMGNWGVWHDASEPPAYGKFLDDLDPRGRALLERYAPAEATDSARIPSIHMPRWASRLTLVITATKIESLQKITDADAIAEGVDWNPTMGHFGCTPGKWFDNAWPLFRDLWCRLHGPDAWDANPEVVALTFAIHKLNIDAMERAA